MRSFEGFLDGVERGHDSILVRIVAGGFEPNPEVPPVLLVTVQSPVGAEALYAELVRAKEVDDGCYFAVHSDSEAMLTTDHGSEVTLRGSSVSVAEGQYDERDFGRLAKQNHEWGMSQYRALTSQSERLETVRQLLLEQHARLSVKIQGHAPGTAAHTLYEQHLSFLSRVLAESAA